MKFQNTIGRLVGVAHQLFLKNLQQEFERNDLPLTAEQFKMMSRLWERDGISQQRLAEGVGRNRAAAGRMIDTLENKDLIERRNDERDRRLNLIFLTEEGKRMRFKAEECAKTVLDRSMKDFSDAEGHQLKHAIRKIIENLT